MRKLRWTLLLGMCMGVAGAAPAVTPLADEVKQAVLEIYSIAPKDQLEWFRSVQAQAVDITGDGTSEVVVELERLETHGHAQCNQTVLGKTPAGWAEVYRFSCCHVVAQPGKLRCDDDKKALVLVQWKGSWPSFTRSPTRTEARARLKQGMGLIEAKKYDEAAKLLCNLQIQGAPVAEWSAACGWARLRQGKPEEAERAFRSALETEPTYAKAYLGLGAVAEEKKAPAEAAGHYRKYLQMRPSSSERATLEGKIAALDKGAGAGSPRAMGPVAAGDCAAICDKLLACKAGPWSSKEECGPACEAANEDPVAGKTYRCVAQGKDCAAVNRCAR